MTTMNIRIDSRFHGPPNSANGGYASGRIAAMIGNCVEVTLRRPPPLDVDLELRSENGGAALYDGDQLVGSARAASVPRVDFPSLTVEQARDAARHTFPNDRHPLPTCFVCGPQRAHGDGLNIRVGPTEPADTDWEGVLAAPWVPHPSLGDDQGAVLHEFVWAALDCPTGFACSSSHGMRIILLGRQTVAIERSLQVGEEYIVVARQTGHDGRKFFAESALLDTSGTRLAVCTAIWIEVSEAVQKGLST